MAKAQTDIRTTSYDELQARPFGYQGTIEDALEQIRGESDEQAQHVSARAELLKYLGIDKVPSAGPSVELDENPRYGEEPSDEPGKYTLAYALKNFPESFYRNPDSNQSLADRFANLTDSQIIIYGIARREHGVYKSLDIAERYPYPSVVQS